MDWDQIESKWAAMTRRVGGHLSITKSDATGKSPRGPKTTDASTTTGADQQIKIAPDQKMMMLT
jgi:hypothetical protein